MAKKQFVIRLNGLDVGKHIYEFKVDNTFFDQLDYSDIKGADVNVQVELLKQNTVTNLTFTINGTLQAICDRCTIPFDVEIHSVEEMHLRHGNPDEPHPDNVMVLPHGENELNLSAPLYEFITLAMPARLVPCEENDTFECDYETLNKLDHISLQETEPKPNSPFDKLKNINFNNN
jgi:uncharacterized metal-binding protein YceD (DUF177 family)